MTLPADLVAFLTVMLRGAFLSCEALVLGGLVFTRFLAQPLAAVNGAAGAETLDTGLRWMVRSAYGLLVVIVVSTALGLTT